MKDKNGKILSNPEEQKTRWAEHFNEILNRPPPNETFEFNQIEEIDELPILMTLINQIEAKNATERLTNHKAAGEDKVTAELLKATSDENLEKLVDFYNNIWMLEEIPKDWKNGTIVKIPKKGGLTDCNHWRGIPLLSVPGKVFCSIILGRIRKAIDEKLREEQAGFRPGR